MGQNDITLPNQRGQKLDYDPSWTGPLQVKRTPTDVGYLKLLAIFCIVWLCVVVYAQSNSEGNHKNINTINEDNVVRYHTTKISVAPIFYSWIIICTLMSIAYVISLRWYTKMLVSIKIFFAFVIFFGVICFLAVECSKNSETIVQIGFKLSAIIFIFLILCLVKKRKNIDFACKVIQEASESVVCFPSTIIIFSLLSFTILLAITSYAINTAENLLRYIISEPYHNYVPIFSEICLAINIFGFYWLVSFTIGFFQMVISGTVGTWYWTQNKTDVPRFTLFRFLILTVTNHLGSLALGSLIMPICPIIIFLLNLIRMLLEGYYSPLHQFGLYHPIFSKFETTIRCINQNAYIMSALHGTKLFDSGKNAFQLFMRNNMVRNIDSLPLVILTFGQLLIIGLSVFGASLCSANQYNSFKPGVSVGMGIFSLIITSLYIRFVIKTSINTIRMCMVEDCERHEELIETPCFMTDKLKKILLIH